MASEQIEIGPDGGAAVRMKITLRTQCPRQTQEWYVHDGKEDEEEFLRKEIEKYKEKHMALIEDIAKLEKKKEEAESIAQKFPVRAEKEERKLKESAEDLRDQDQKFQQLFSKPKDSMERKRLRVDGIPTDIPTSRVKDKLTIHFFRSKFGGAEVKNIEIVQEAAAYAIVTFEDDQVTENVLKIKDHTLQVSDKIYNLVVSEVNGNVDLDELFENMSLKVNYKKFPEKYQSLLTNLMETHKCATFDFDEKSMTCTISGPYAEVQNTAQEILSKLHIVHTNQKQISSDSQRKAMIELSKNHPELPQALDHPHAPLSGTTVKKTCSEKAKTLEQLQEPLIWETDIFKYMQQFHLREYQDIQKRYHILAVDENYNEVTEIYLETESGGKPHLGDFKCAQSELMVLYRGLELLLHKEQIKKSMYRDQQFYDSLTTDLKKLFPMLHFHADDRKLYLIGYGVDVSDAKRYILELHTKVDRMPGNLDKQFGASNISTELPHSPSPTKKHQCSVGSRISALCNAPTTQSLNSAKSHVDEEHLVSSTSPRRLPQDRENDLSDTISFKSNMADDLQKNEAASCSRPDEKSDSTAMPSVKRQDVLPALVRGDLGNSGATPKPTGILKPIQITKASSELPYLRLVDISPPCADFSVAELKPRRSNSLSRVYSKGRTSTEPHSDTLVFKDEVNVTHWQWYYITQICKSDLDMWCSKVELTSEIKKNGKVALKMKSLNKKKVATIKEMIQLLSWKLDIRITHSHFDYASLGVQGPEDETLTEWCDLFRKCSRELSVKLEKDKLVLLYPKKIQTDVLDAYRQHRERKIKSSGDATMPDIRQVSLQDRFESSATDGGEDYITERKQSLTHKQRTKPKQEDIPFLLGGEEMDEEKKYIVSKHLADERYALLAGTEPFQVISVEHEAFIKPVPETLDKKSTHPQKLRDFPEDTQNRSTSEKTDYYTLTETFARSPYTSNLLTQGIDVSPRNVPVLLEPHYGEQGISTEDGVVQYQGSSPQLWTPAVGQESDMTSSICGNCKNIGKTVQTSSGQMQCVKCFATCVITALNEAAKAPLIASMSHTAMSLRLPGYEGDTSLKIIYKVADGVQGAGDPQPGCQYKGGRFEAYLPDNREGRKLLSLLQRALDQGLIFHVKSFAVGEEVTWYKIPHKTSPDGGKAKNGYPDLTYVRDTIALLYQYGID
ncbi:uncharacterized protein LOC130296515 isoform X1 [Hyla sarda]|uniref:uncharacterized protein LOC130296515 isoform X1 n=1 Tax=Hyla sarda TaxID=327740 RepID=UPI0024C2F4F0|nr:uncharacterized protein LOC130296515 isoform X1 [Hyla sarda]